MKKFRRISTLALVIVLVCLCAASAFAAEICRNDTCGNANVEFTVATTNYSARSTIVADGNISPLSGYVQVTAYCYESRTSANISTTTQTQNTTGNGATKTISFGENEIFILHKAVGLYKVTIDSAYYAPSSLTVTHYTK